MCLGKGRKAKEKTRQIPGAPFIEDNGAVVEANPFLSVVVSYSMYSTSDLFYRGATCASA